MHELSTLGFGSFFEEQVRQLSGDVIPARVAAEHRGGYDVWAQAGAGFAQLAGRLTRGLEDEEYPGVGDWVVLRSQPGPGNTTIIDNVLNRRTVFLRGAAGPEARAQVVAANVDLVFAVCGLDANYNVRRIERYVARIWASGAQPVVVLNKGDVCGHADERVSEVESHCPGVQVLVTSALHSGGLDAIRGLVPPGITAALVGSSGVGKSTLVNALTGEQLMATGEIRAHDGRGRHVTTHRQLVQLPAAGLLLDTPGMRELQLVDEDGIGAVFPDIEELSLSCRFADCAHDSEPGCAVRNAVESGRLSAERLGHYLKLEKEAQAFELRRNEHSRRKSERVWGQLRKEGDRIRRWKGDV